jgi:hypothetical protein
MRIDIKIDLPLLVPKFLETIRMNVLQSAPKRNLFHRASMAKVTDLIISHFKTSGDKPPEHRN